MCQRSTREVPLQMIVNSMCELIRQVKENTCRSMDYLSEHDSQLKTGFINAKQTAEQLQNQLEEILRDLELAEGKGKSQQTMITFFE